MEEVAGLRQLVGQVQELWDLYGPQIPDRRLVTAPHHHNHPRWYLLDFENGSIKDDYCGLIIGEETDLLKMVEANITPRKKHRKERNQAKALFSSATEAMNEEIWKEFPEDLFDAVIARLPIAAIFRFRSVCRKWCSLFASESFSQHFATVPCGYPWFYTVTHENGNNNAAMYDPSMRKWHHPSIDLTPEKGIIIPVASAGGLVCLLDIGNRNFYICNPLTHALKELPPRSVRGWSRVAVGMTLNDSTSKNGYKILWLGGDGDHEIYDSLKDSWVRPGILPPSITLPLALNFRSQTVSIDSTLYFMRTEPDGILSYDVSTGTWRQFIIPSPLHLVDHSLAEFRGRVLLVGLLCKNAATCVCIWELQKMTLLWKEVDRMPNILCLEFYGKHVRMTCLGNQGLLMLSLRAKRMNRLVTYNMSSKEWQKLPDCMLPGGRKRQSIACGTAFDPYPAALA